MTFRAACAAAFLLVSATHLGAQAASPPRTPLRIVSAGPSGEVAAVEEANEVRVVFSESMVPLGRVPAKLGPAFFHISPAVAGTFRWSGTTILIFTPARKLPLATKYDVRIDASAAAESGRRLDRPYSLHVHDTDGAAAADPLVPAWRSLRSAAGDRAALQPADQAGGCRGARHGGVAAASVRATRILAGGDRAAAGPATPDALQAFEAKVAAARAAASATSSVTLQPCRRLGQEAVSVPARDMVVLEATAAVPPDSWVRVTVDGRLPSLAGPAVSTKAQDYTIKVLPTFFINGFDCRAGVRPGILPIRSPCGCR